MGLLTNPSLSQLNSKIFNYSIKFSWLCYLIGLVYFFVLPYTEYSHRTYFSENALLPGLVTSQFDEAPAINKYVNDLKSESEKYQNSIPFPWLEAKFRQMGLEVYTHNYTIKHPLGKQQTSGENIYAILRAPRASSTEALVFSVPYRPPTSLEKGTAASIGVLLASAKFFSKKSFWAKDIIFLITQHEQLGMQAWLEAYHQISCGSGALVYGDLNARAGSIQAAINLEMSDTVITHFNVKIEGLNGQLPNLDLVNLVHRLSGQNEVGQMFQSMEDHPYPFGWKGYKKQLKTMSYMMMKQATGIPTGNHGLFHRFGIQALTIEGVFRSKRRMYAVRADKIGRVVEGIFRSLNNLLERFHQSFFFYLLPSTTRYVSIGLYMPAFGFLGGSFVIAGIGMWFLTIQDDREKIKNIEDNKKVDEQEKEEEEEAIRGCFIAFPVAILDALPSFMLAHLFGFIFAYLPEVASILGRKFMNLESENSVTLAIFSFFLIQLISPKLFGPATKLNNQTWKVIKCFTLLELGILSFLVSLSNFSLAFIVTTFYVPVALMASPSKSLLAKLIKILLCFLIHPLTIVTIFACVGNFYYMEVFNIENFINATKSALMYSIIDTYIYGSVIYPLATLCLTPCWYLLWSLNFTTDKADDQTLVKSKMD